MIPQARLQPNAPMSIVAIAIALQLWLVLSQPVWLTLRHDYDLTDAVFVHAWWDVIVFTTTYAIERPRLGLDLLPCHAEAQQAARVARAKGAQLVAQVARRLSSGIFSSITRFSAS